MIILHFHIYFDLQPLSSQDSFNPKGNYVAQLLLCKFSWSLWITLVNVWNTPPPKSLQNASRPITHTDRHLFIKSVQIVTTKAAVSMFNVCFTQDLSAQSNFNSKCNWWFIFMTSCNICKCFMRQDPAILYKNSLCLKSFHQALR